MTKTIERLMEKAATKGYAKNGAWEIEQVQGSFIRVMHYGTMILKLEFNTHPATVTEIESPSMSDRRVMNYVLKQFNAFRYPNTIKGFRDWATNNPSFFHSDDVEGSRKYSYDKSTKVYTESSMRKGFMSEEITHHSSSYTYNEERGNFSYHEAE